MTQNYVTPTEVKPLSLCMDEELRKTSNNVLDGYTISNRGIIYDPQGEEVKPTGYRGRKVIGIKGYMVFYDWAVGCVFLGGPRQGYYLRHKDGDLLNCDVDNLEWKPRSTNNYVKKKQPKEAPTPAPKEQPQRPKGWIRRYSIDGILVREYVDVDQLVAECIHFGEVSLSQSNNIASLIRRTFNHPEHYRSFLGSKWKVSDLSVLNSKKFGIHPERYPQPPTLMEYTPATATWIKRYIGPWLVQTFENIDEAVDYVSANFGVRQQPARQRLTDYMKGNGRDASLYGSRWEASGPEALKSVHTSDMGGRPKKQSLPPAEVGAETLKAVEPIAYQPTVKETPKKKTSKKPTTTIKEESTDTSRPTFEIDFCGDMSGVKVEVRKVDNFVRLRISL